MKRRNLLRNRIVPVLFGFFLFFTNCSKNDQLTSDKDLKSIIAIKDNQTALSKFALTLGVTGIKVMHRDDAAAEFLIKGESSMVNNVVVDLNNSKIGLFSLNSEEVKLSIDNRNAIRVNFKDNKVYFNGTLVNDDFVKKLARADMQILTNLAILYKEITDEKLIRHDYDTWKGRELLKTPGEEKECYFTSWSLRESRSFAEYRAEKQADEFLKANSGCEKIGEVDSSCLLGSDHICVASVTIACSGGACN